MDEMVESVLLLCPGCDREEVENDLNLTGDLERTINRALDGMLSPCRMLPESVPPIPLTNESTPVIIMDDDNSPTTSKYTNIKDKTTESGLKPKDITTDAFLEISDSDSEKYGTLGDHGGTHGICRSIGTSDVHVEKYTNNADKPFIRAESPESDDESLPPAFDDNEHVKSFSSRIVSRDTSKDILLVPDLDQYSVLSSTVTKNNNVENVLSVEDVRVEKLAKNVTVSNEEDCSGGSDPPVPSLNEPVKKRKKRTKEEIEEQKRINLLKKQAREKERLEKQEEKRRQKEVKAAEMKQKKLDAEKEKLQKKAEKLTESTLKLGACVKFVTVCLDPSFFTDDVSGLCQSIIVQKLCAMEVNYKIQPQLHPGSITWQRTSVQHSVEGSEDLTITSSNSYSDENEVLIVLKTEQFAEMVYAFKQEHQAIGEKDCQTLVEFTKNIKDLYRGKMITFLLSGLEKYMRNVKTKQQRAFREVATGSSDDSGGNRKRKKKKISPTLDVTRTDIEEALVDLQIKTNVCVYPCESDEDVGTKIALFTKAVAERPYKKSLTDGFGFCLDKLDKTSLKVSKDGQGLVRVWQQQIEQFRNVSRDMASAIVAVYPSPQLLLRAYEQCMTEREALFLLEDIMVRRGGGSLATSKRIGPELSKRFYILFHSKDNSELMKKS